MTDGGPTTNPYWRNQVDTPSDFSLKSLLHAMRLCKSKSYQRRIARQRRLAVQEMLRQREGTG